MNAVVCLIHFTGVWLVCDFAALFFKKAEKHYYAGWTAIVLSFAVLTAGWILDHGVWATRYTIATPKVSAPFRIVQFADSHIGTTFDGKGFAKHVKTMQSENPDIVPRRYGRRRRSVGRNEDDARSFLCFRQP